MLLVDAGGWELLNIVSFVPFEEPAAHNKEIFAIIK
jgi:hypothetical protein